ncbi:MAG: hypothetical protein ACYDBQ_03470 [Thermoplasmatota archaeon]
MAKLPLAEQEDLPLVDTTCESCGRTFQCEQGAPTSFFEDGSHATICVDCSLAFVRSDAFVHRAVSREAFLRGRRRI